MAFRPLAGLRVLDLSRHLPGPFLSQILVDLGADVIKIEEPESGDPARGVLPEAEGTGYLFAAVNRGKRSVALDLRKPGAADALLRLAASCDVILDSFRPGVMDRLGLGDDVLAARNPRLVRVALVGYPEGPLRDAPGHDLNYESVAGILAIQGTTDAPVGSAVPLADLAGALYGATGLLAALLERERTGLGRRIEIALADAALAMNGIHLQRAEADATPPARGKWELAGGLACYRTYRCADQRHVALAALEEKFWSRFVDAVADPSLAPLHLAASPEAHRRLEALFLTRSRDAWADLALRHGIPLTPVLEPEEAARLAAMRLGGLPGPATPLTGEPSRGAPPALGADTDRTLADAGFTPDEVERLRECGALGRHPKQPRSEAF